MLVPRTTFNCTLMLLTLVTALGCGGDRAEVTGRLVQANGEPLAGAQVVARSEDGKTATGTADASGQFSLSSLDDKSGIAPGDYDVIILEDRGRPDNMRSATIPSRYADPTQSGLSFSVQAGENKVLDIAVERR